MARSDPRGQFGVHSVHFYNRTAGEIVSNLRVIGEFSMNFSADFAKLVGGSQMFAYDIEPSAINGEITFKAREFEANMMAAMMGGTLTKNAAEANGAVAGVANVKGTSIISATHGVDTVELSSGDSADLKEGKYLLKATAAQVLSLYGMTDVDFLRGTDLDFDDDDLLIESGITISSTDVVIEELGITLSRIGTPAFTTGDTAVFYIRKPNSGSVVVDFGQAGAEFAELGCYVAGQKQSDGTIVTIELFKVKGAGFPIGFTEKGWAEWTIKMEALYDSVKNKVGTYRRTIAV